MLIIQTNPFRVWYSKLDELRALMKHVNFLVFSVTVSSAAKLKIYTLLSFDFVNTFSIMKSPLKTNLRYSINYVEKAKIDEIFENMICAFEDRANFPRTLIICQTRKQVSLLFRHFSNALNNQLYVDGQI